MFHSEIIKREPVMNIGKF